jgi:hypothetical protein
LPYTGEWHLTAGAKKAIVALTVLVGHLAGEAPPSLMGLIMLTNLPWIPPLLYCDITLRKIPLEA